MALIWILLGFALYWSLVAALDSLGVLKKYGMSAWGPLFLIKTLRGRKLLDRLAKPKRFWRAYGNLGIALALIVMGITFLLLLLTGIMNILSPPEPSQYTEPRNIVAIPGINDFLPLTMAPEIIIGLLIGIVVHEGGHGIMCRVGNINVSSMGLVTLAVLPIGAFVEPDEDEVEVASQGERTRMFAAGVMNNFVITAVVFVLLALSMTAIQPVQGVGVQQVLEDTPAGEAGLVEGDIIKSINGEQVRSLEEFSEIMGETEPGQEVEVVISRDGSTLTKTVALGKNPRDDSGYLGILMYDISGVHSILSSYNPIRWVISIFMPFQIGGALFFNGFHGDVTQFYRLTGPATLLGGYYWAIPNILFWTAWINFNLAFFNCVPAVPLDGGHILREVVSRTMRPFFSGERLEEVAGVVTMAVAIMMFGSLILMVVAPRLLS